MNYFAHNGIDHIHHADMSAEHASQPNYLLITLLVVAAVSAIAYIASRRPTDTSTARSKNSTTKKGAKN